MFGETSRKSAVEVLVGDETADVAVVNGKHVNVHTGEIIQEDIAIKGDRIVAVGEIEQLLDDETEIISADGQYVCPGLIEGHLHSYHSFVNCTDFSKLLLEHGTTAYADGFYGQAVVSGTKAIEFLKEEIERTPLKLILLVPTLANSQMVDVGIPPSPNQITMEEMNDMVEWDDCYGLEEPTYLPVSDLNQDYLDLFEKTINEKKVVTGHAVNPTREQLTAFIAAGASTDHEMSTPEGALERARNGMANLSRYGSNLPHMVETIKSVTERRIDTRQFGFSSDVILPEELNSEIGCIDENVRVAIKNGVDPISAVQMATINTAQALRLDQELGSIAPGKVADLVMVDDLAKFEIESVVANGQQVVSNGELELEIESPEYPEWTENTIKLGKTTQPTDFRIESGEPESVTARTIQAPPPGGQEHAQRQTKEGKVTLPVEDGAIQIPEGGDVVKAAMLDRHGGSGRIGFAFVEGFGLEHGAVGISYNSILNNIVVIGTNDTDMSVAVNRIEELNGGAVAIKDQEVIAEIPLELFGMQAKQPPDELVDQFQTLYREVEAQLGCSRENILFDIEFMVAPSPENLGYRVTDHGLINVEKREQLDLIL